VTGGSNTGTRLASAEVFTWTHLGATIAMKGPGTASPGDDFDLTFSTTGVSPQPYAGYIISVVYDSSLLSVTGIEDRSVTTKIQFQTDTAATFAAGKNAVATAGETPVTLTSDESYVVGGFLAVLKGSVAIKITSPLSTPAQVEALARQILG
jgi:hypothetical protein